MPIEGSGDAVIFGDPERFVVGTYLNDLRATSLLTPGEEVSLGKTLRAERLMGEVAAHGLEIFMAEQGLKKGRQIEAGTLPPGLSVLMTWAELLREPAANARRQLITSNLRLVVSIAKRYAIPGMQFPDLIQEGNLGLMHAAEKYDWRSGYRFATYATFWVRQSILGNFGEAQRIRRPRYLQEAIARLSRVRRQLTEEKRLAGNYHAVPTIAEVAERSGLSEDRIRDLDEIVAREDGMLALDAPIHDDDDRTAHELLTDQTLDANETETDFTRDAVAKALKLLTQEKRLTEREATVLRMRFGLDTNEAMTLGEVGEAFGLTRERIRQIEAKALAKLRSDPQAAHLQEFLE